MIELTMISTEEELKEFTGLTHKGLWNAGFDLDDWDVCFVSSTRLVGPPTDDDIEYGYMYGKPIDDAYWLIRRMEGYYIGFKEVQYKGNYFYTVYHA